MRNFKFCEFSVRGIPVLHHLSKFQPDRPGTTLKTIGEEEKEEEEEDEENTENQQIWLYLTNG
jgi:hypothetical protein